MEDDFWKELPLTFKIYFLGVVGVTLAMIGFAVWVIIKLLQNWNVI